MAPALDVLLLANDHLAGKLVRAFFENHVITLVSSPAEAAVLTLTEGLDLFTF